MDHTQHYTSIAFTCKARVQTGIIWNYGYTNHQSLSSLQQDELWSEWSIAGSFAAQSICACAAPSDLWSSALLASVSHILCYFLCYFLFLSSSLIQLWDNTTPRQLCQILQIIIESSIEFCVIRWHPVKYDVAPTEPWFTSTSHWEVAMRILSKMQQSSRKSSHSRQLQANISVFPMFTIFCCCSLSVYLFSLR